MDADDTKDDGSREVLLDEVAAFAKNNHAQCNGKGFVDRITVRAGKEVRTPEACPCALRRFVRKHGGAIADRDGKMFWKPVTDVPAPPGRNDPVLDLQKSFGQDRP